MRPLVLVFIAVALLWSAPEIYQSLEELINSMPPYGQRWVRRILRLATVRVLLWWAALLPTRVAP